MSVQQNDPGETAMGNRAGQTRIRYDLISAAILYYQTRGYQYTEVPWAVSESVCQMTYTGENWGVTVPCMGGPSWIGALIGSGEQGLLSRAGELKEGMWMTATPCFRIELPQDWKPGIVQEQFFKVELMILNPKHPGDAIEKCLLSARRFMEANGGLHRIKVVQTTQGFDLEVDGIEVGSYGFRQTSGVSWVYGTGLAEPRFSTVLHA